MSAAAILATITVPAAGSAQKDAAALVDMYKSLGGESWPSGPKKWNIDAPQTMCSWHNVTCDTNGRVSKLDFMDMEYVVGTLPNTLVNLDQLTELRFKRNSRLSGTIPDQIGKLQHLTTLTVGRNQVSGTIPFSTYSLKNLKQLYFKQNRMSGTLSEALGNLKQLKVLDLRESKFYGTVPNTITTMARLEVLNLEDNAWRGFLPIPPGGLIECELTDKTFQSDYSTRVATPLESGYGESNSQFFCPLPEYVPEACQQHLYCTTDPDTAPAMNDCTVLYDMYLSMNGEQWENADGKRIKWSNGEDPASCCDWERVQCRKQDNRVKGLDLRFISGMTGTLPPSIGNLDKLTGLRMKGTPISGTIPDEIGLLSKLQALEIGRDKVSGTIPFSLYGLSELDEIYFKHNKMSGTISEAIGALQKLKQFDVRESKFDGTLPRSISTLENLQQFIVEDNKFRGFLPELPKGILECSLTDKTFEAPYDEKRRTRPQFDGEDWADARFNCPLPKSLPEACQPTAFCNTEPVDIVETPYVQSQPTGGDSKGSFKNGLTVGLVAMGAAMLLAGYLAYACRKNILRMVVTEASPLASAHDVKVEQKGSTKEEPQTSTVAQSPP